MAAVEFVQRELWGGREGASAWVPAALGCWGDAVSRHSEGTVHVLTGGLCGLDPTFVFSSFTTSPSYLTFSACVLLRPQ